ncbi:hypothetical protein BGZ72_001575 [Mortierella alpina]|nr:hypothetical protein BGZ72_001575 [Mortierella alpina]
MDEDDNASVVFSWSDNDDELKDEITALEQSIDTQIPPKPVPEIINEDSSSRWRTPEPPRSRIRKWDLKTAPPKSGPSRADSSSNTERSDVVRKGDLRNDIEKLEGQTRSRDVRADVRPLENTPLAGRDLRDEITVMTNTFSNQVLSELPPSASSHGDTQASIAPVSIKLVARQKEVEIEIAVEDEDKGRSEAKVEVEVEVKVKRTAVRSEYAKKHLAEQDMGEGDLARQQQCSRHVWRHSGTSFSNSNSISINTSTSNSNSASNSTNNHAGLITGLRCNNSTNRSIRSRRNISTLHRSAISGKTRLRLAIRSAHATRICYRCCCWNQ